MNKWGVRLISCLFFISPISNVYNLTTGGRIDVITLVSGVFHVYIGVQLLRFQPSGRDWALFFFWLGTIIVGVLCTWIIILSIYTLYTGTSFPYELHPKWGGEINDPIIFSVISIGFFLCCFVPTYFLMRKDTKILFQKANAIKENNVHPDVPFTSDQTITKK